MHNRANLSCGEEISKKRCKIGLCESIECDEKKRGGRRDTSAL